MTKETTEAAVEPTFDPKTINLNSPNINAVIARSVVDDVATNEIRVNWVHNYAVVRDHESNQRPAWADLPIDERVYMALPDNVVTHAARAVLQQPNGLTFELPCPPYTFEYEDSKLSISAGAFTKSGTKAEWRQVLDQMQEEVDGMPDGIDVTHLPDITLYIEVKASTTHDISVDTLLSDHDMYDGEMFTGDADDLQYALERAIENLMDYDLDIDMHDADVEEVDMTSNDLDYCMRQVN